MTSATLGASAASATMEPTATLRSSMTHPYLTSKFQALLLLTEHILRLTFHILAASPAPIRGPARARRPLTGGVCQE